MEKILRRGRYSPSKEYPLGQIAYQVKWKGWKISNLDWLAATSFHPNTMYMIRIFNNDHGYEVDIDAIDSASLD